MIWVVIINISKNIQRQMAGFLSQEALNKLKAAVDSGHLPKVQDLTNQGFPEGIAHHLADHLTYSKELHEKNILKGGGPCARSEKAILIFECDTEEEVRGYVEEDPYYKNGIFIKPYDIYNWHKIF
ncbi:MAG: YciI family protein [Thermodesulfobacteriota bacterium]|nr:YciI family protein [Thermodesulfobacteriota bacterium]